MVPLLNLRDFPRRDRELAIAPASGLLDPLLSHLAYRSPKCPFARRRWRTAFVGSARARQQTPAKQIAERFAGHLELDRASCSANQRILPTRTRKQCPDVRARVRSRSSAHFQGAVTEITANSAVVVTKQREKERGERVTRRPELGGHEQLRN